MEEKQFHGLSSAEVDDRIRMGHSNTMNISVSKTRGEIVKEHSLTYFNFLNLFLAILVATTGQVKNMTFMGVIFFNTAIGIFQELKVKRLVDKISVMTVTTTKVIRNGEKKEVPVNEVVIDDIICVESGQQICADCTILDTDGIEVNESMITGESRPVKKQAGEKLLSGSYIVAGTCIGKVFHVGEDNYAVSLAKRARIKKRASSQMQEIIKKIIKIDGILLIPIGILLYLSQKAIEGTGSADAIIGTVAGVIGMIPEGLVLLTSVSFVLGVGRLAKQKALVQEMESIEALARVNVLCLDKTGTITTGKLEVKEVVPIETDSERIEEVMRELTWAFDDVNNTQEALRRRFRKSATWKTSLKIPFSSERKYRAVSFEEQGSFVLGAPEFLVNEDTELLKKVEDYSKDGIRVLLLGQCTLSDQEDSNVSDVIPMGLLLITDEIRSEAADTFTFFRESGVAIKIISGDNPGTVSNIALKAGLIGAESYIDARNLPTNMEGMQKAVEKYTVFGRVKPEQKQDIIKACQNNGNVVGMVGDGVNDVLALKDADCGIAMAAGSDAAKQVAHIVLLDSNFASMKNIVSEGFTIIGNIEKVSALYLTKTIYSILLCVIFIFWRKAYPFIPIQLSWISGLGIGIPSFLLTLEKNNNRVSNGFFVHVMKNSLPAALTMVCTLMLTEVLSPFWGCDGGFTALFNLTLGGIVSLFVVYRVCRPMNRYHRFLCHSLTVIFMAGILLVPEFLGIHRLICWQGLFLIPMTSMVIMMNRGMTDIFEWVHEHRKISKY